MALTITQEQVVSLMASSRSEAEWNDNCDLVKRIYNGYPKFWYNAIILSGLCERTLSACRASNKEGKNEKS